MSPKFAEDSYNHIELFNKQTCMVVPGKLVIQHGTSDSTLQKNYSVSCVNMKVAV